MTRTALPFSAPDLSALARFLERNLDDHLITHGRLPGHVEMMNLLARGVGKRNLQSLQAEAAAAPSAAADGTTPAEDAWFHAPPIDAPEAPPPAVPELSAHARKAIEHFDAAGRLTRWPLKLSVQRLAMWVLWTRFDARRTYTEPEVNSILKAWNTWGDHVTLRRELIDHGLMTRRSDCTAYRKLPLRPNAEVLAMLQALRTASRERPARRAARAPVATAA